MQVGSSDFSLISNMKLTRSLCPLSLSKFVAQIKFPRNGHWITAASILITLLKTPDPLRRHFWPVFFEVIQHDGQPHSPWILEFVLIFVFVFGVYKLQGRVLTLCSLMGNTHRVMHSRQDKLSPQHSGEGTIYRLRSWRRRLRVVGKATGDIHPLWPRRYFNRNTCSKYHSYLIKMCLEVWFTAGTTLFQMAVEEAKKLKSEKSF